MDDTDLGLYGLTYDKAIERICECIADMFVEHVLGTPGLIDQLTTEADTMRQRRKHRRKMCVSRRY